MNDVRLALRGLVRSPGFTVVAVVAVALGIGANTAVFTIVDSVLLRPLPFPEPERLYALAIVTDGPFGVDDRRMPDGLYVDFRKHDHFFEKLTAYNSHRINMTGAGDARSIFGAFATADFFSVLGANAALGRTFAPDEDQPGHDGVVVISDRLWHSAFGADPEVIGRRVRLDGESHTVIGVMPAGFAFPEALDVWLPHGIVLNPHNSWSLSVVGRIKPGLAASQATAELDLLLKQLPDSDFDGKRQRPPARVVSLLESVSGKVQRSLLIFLGAVAFVLLIACANVANLLLARAAGRRQEIAVRAALGASRWRLIRQLLTESTLVSLAGGVAGLVLAVWSVPALVALAPPNLLPRAEQIGIDGWVLAFTFAVSLGTGLGFGMIPAIQATRAELRESLSLGRTLTGRHERLRGALVVAEIALSLVLLTGAGLMLKSFLRLRSADTGFRSENVITMILDLPENAYREAPQLHAFQDRTLEKLARLPGVTAVAAVNYLPLGGSLTMGDFRLEGGRQFPKGLMVDKPDVSIGYFHAMGIRLLRGRDFTGNDNSDAPPVAVVSQSAARRIWPGEDPIGKRFTEEEENPKPKDWATVVGVVEDVKQMGMADKPREAVYQPLAQTNRPYWLNHVAFVVRTASDPEGLAAAMRGVVRDVDRNQPVQQIATMQTLIDASTAEPRFQTRLLGAFSLLALLLAAVGTYGVLAYSVAQRTHEIGIRMALGAERRDVLRLVLRRTLMLAGAGVLIGAAGALAVTRVLEKFLYEVKPNDPLTFVPVAVLLAGVAILAGWIPAWRATRVDPVEALRYE